MIDEERILTGAEALNKFFKNSGTHHICNSNGANKNECPPQTFFPKIECNKSSYKNIKRRPYSRTSKKKQHNIQKTVGCLAVDFYEKPLIPGIQLAPDRNHLTNVSEEPPHRRVKPAQ